MLSRVLNDAGREWAVCRTVQRSAIENTVRESIETVVARGSGGKKTSIGFVEAEYGERMLQLRTPE